MPENAQPVEIKPYSLKELAELYRISIKVLKKWLQPLIGLIGPRIGRCYKPRQVEIIFRELGYPRLATALDFSFI